jgi:hypothetical protein
VGCFAGPIISEKVDKEIDQRGAEREKKEESAAH